MDTRSYPARSFPTGLLKGANTSALDHRSSVQTGQDKFDVVFSEGAETRTVQILKSDRLY